MDIYEELNKFDFIKEYEIIGKTVIFSADKEVLYKNIAKYGEDYDFIQVPYIPRDEKGILDKTSIEKFGFIPSKTYFELEKNLLKSDIKNDIKISYKNTDKGITLEYNESARTKSNEIEISNSNKLAVSTSEPLINNRKYENLTELFKVRSQSKQKTIYIEKDGQEEQTYEELYKEASYLATSLREKGLKQGDKLIFQLPDNKNFIKCFWACMLLGVIPAPTGVLDDYSVENVNTKKLYNIWKHIDEPFIITTDKLKDDVLKLGEIFSDNINVIAIDDTEASEAFENYYDWDVNETSLILFTSGSTGMPKGVTLSQKNIFGRTLGEIQMYNLNENEVDFNWMTLTHAAGLIWSHIRDVYLNILQIQVNSEVILNKPLMWIDLMSKYKVSITWAPNFAYTLVNNYIQDDKDYDWDLSRLNYVFSGGEANVSKNLRSFLKKLEKYSLPKNALKLTFGMTETSSCITYYNDFSYYNNSDDDKFLPVGAPMPGAEIRIVDEDGNVAKEGEIGHVQGKGESFTSKYYKNEKANNESFTDDGYLITGDIGYIKDNNLVLTAREKDIIIINGLNYFVQDLEAAVDDMDEVNASFSVATSVKLKDDDNEMILVFFSPKDEELLKDEANIEELKELVLKVKNQIREKCLLNPQYVIPLLSEELQTTEIGKKQRNNYKYAFLAGKFNEIINKIEDKNLNYILTKEWVRKEIQYKELGNVCVINNDKNIDELFEKNNVSFKSIDNITDVQENDILLDFFFYDENDLEISSQNLSYVLDRASTHIKDIMKISKKLIIIFPTKQSINFESDMTFRINNGFINGLLKTVCLENPFLRCRIVDFDKLNISLLVNELNLSIKDEVSVYRDSKRYIPCLKTVNKGNCNEAIIPSDSLVLVVGGLGGIGIHVSKYLINKYNSKLLIIGSSDLEKNIDKYNELIHISEDVIYCKADVTNYQEILDSVNKAEHQFGIKLSTIVNLSGKMSSDNSGVFFDNLSDHTLENEEFKNMLDSSSVKLLGTYNLEKIRKSKEEASMIVFCSLTGNFGGISMGAYSLANTLQENYCQSLINLGGKVFCINWSMWSKTGLNKYSNSSSAVFGGFNELDIEQGIGYLNFIIENNIKSSYVGINRECLKMRYQVHDFYDMNLIINIDDKNKVQKVKDIIKENYSNLTSRLVCKIDKSRFNSDANISELQNKLMMIWKDNLKVEEIHINDNIFDLGGNSLTIFKIVEIISDEFNMNIKPIDIMIYPNIYQLSTYLYSKNKNNGNLEVKKKDSLNIRKRKEMLKNRRR